MAHLLHNKIYTHSGCCIGSVGLSAGSEVFEVVAVAAVAAVGPAVGGWGAGEPRCISAAVALLFMPAYVVWLTHICHAALCCINFTGAGTPLWLLYRPRRPHCYG